MTSSRRAVFVQGSGNVSAETPSIREGLVDMPTFNDTIIDHKIVEPRSAMPVVTVSSKYQIVIPKEVREPLGIRPGQRLRVFRFGDAVTVVPVRPIRAIKGKLPGIDTDVPRDRDRL